MYPSNSTIRSKSIAYSKPSIAYSKSSITYSKSAVSRLGRNALVHAAGLLLFGACSSFCLILVINARIFYRALLSPLGIIAASGFSEEEILLNYNHLIDYCSPFFRGELAFPTFGSSASAISHFAEVKEIFTFFYYVLIFSGGLAAFSMPLLSRSERVRAIRLAGMACLSIPILCLGLFFASFHGEFHQAFYFLHGILFQNMDWLFDPATDPVILILPERYFLCCGVLFLFYLCTAGILLRNMPLFLRCRLHPIQHRLDFR